ncbi:hypothetical protein ACJIZ3_007655 [Penstemon smallii]|uniref:Uncharacterized protein n=1 Tax=Penstemon smallii TaxID=265156 RepID=A0ABD3T7K5_9LAMI
MAFHISNHCWQKMKPQDGRKATRSESLHINGCDLNPSAQCTWPKTTTLESNPSNYYTINQWHWFRLNRARLIIDNFPISEGIPPVSSLLLNSKCINPLRLTIEGGIEPEIRLSARFKTVSRLSFPISAGISPEILLPMRSRILKWGSEAMHGGISPEMSFQSATTRVVSLSSWHMEGEIDPVMVISETRLVSGSQLMPYQLVQQSVPDHVLKMPKYGSLRAALNESSAARSDGGQALTVRRKDSRSVSELTVEVCYWTNMPLERWRIEDKRGRTAIMWFGYKYVTFYNQVLTGQIPLN